MHLFVVQMEHNILEEIICLNLLFPMIILINLQKLNLKQMMVKHDFILICIEVEKYVYLF